MAQSLFVVDGVDIVVPELTRDQLHRIVARDRDLPTTDAGKIELMARDIVELLAPVYPFVTVAWVDRLEWDVAQALFANLVAQAEGARAEQRRALAALPPATEIFQCKRSR